MRNNGNNLKCSSEDQMTLKFELLWVSTTENVEILQFFAPKFTNK